MTNMDMAQANVAGWKRLPNSDNTTPELTSASDSSGGEPLLELDFPYICGQLIPNVNKANSDGDGNSGTSDADFLCQPIRNDTKLVTNSEEPDANPFDDLETAPDIRNTSVPGERPIVVEIPRSTLINPRSIFKGFIPPIAEVRERHALSEFLDAKNMGKTSQQDSHIELDLENFSIYSDGTVHPNALRPLQQFATRVGENFYFDGVVRRGDKHFFLRKVHFR